MHTRIGIEYFRERIRAPEPSRSRGTEHDRALRKAGNMKNRPLIGVAVIVLKEGKVLLGKRKNSHGAGTWQLPGGHLEFFESIEGCGSREVYEETGLEIKNIRRGPYTNDIFAEAGRHYVTLFLIAEVAGGQLKVREPEKCEKWEWFAWHDLPEPKFLPLANLVKQRYAPFCEKNA